MARAAKQDSEYRLITGLEVVGRGIYIRPRQPYELKDVLFERKDFRPYISKETGEEYGIPGGYAVNDSPPMPANQALNQTVIEESWERFDKQMGLDANLAVSNSLFSVDANSSQTKQLRSEDEAYYALRCSFIPLWTVYLPNVSGVSEQNLDFDIPVPFSHTHRGKYDKFFERYGTHYVKRAWVGGKAVLAFTVAKSSQMTKEDIQAGIKASYSGVGSAGVSRKEQETKEKLLTNSECSVFGKGGDELKLAALNTLDEANYNAWLETIKTNPQVIELEVAGIWTLFDDQQKAKTVQEAYKERNLFSPIAAAFGYDNQMYFLRSNEYFRYDIDEGESYVPKPLKEKWPVLGTAGFDCPDAAFVGNYLRSWNNEDLSRKLFIFERNKYIRIDVDTNEIDTGYPLAIAEGFPGVSFDRIDAVFSPGPDTVYFFKGSEYIRYNVSNHHADPGYPEPITKRWSGLTFDRIDAAVYWRDGKVYFFRDDQHIRYDMTIYRADPGYPKFVVGNYVEDWRFFE